LVFSFLEPNPLLHVPGWQQGLIQQFLSGANTARNSYRCTVARECEGNADISLYRILNHTFSSWKDASKYRALVCAWKPVQTLSIDAQYRQFIVQYSKNVQGTKPSLLAAINRAKLFKDSGYKLARVDSSFRGSGLTTARIDYPSCAKQGRCLVHPMIAGRVEGK
jgi:hypothetical protein